MTVTRWLVNVLAVATIIGCIVLTACTGNKKGRCSACSSNSDCQSGYCTSFSDGNNKRLLCAGSSGSETCSVPE